MEYEGNHAMLMPPDRNAGADPAAAPLATRGRQAQPSALGATVRANGVAYCVWAPEEVELTVVVEGEADPRLIRLEAEGSGQWSGFDPAGRAGDLYRFRRADGRRLPDPASRFQPRGVDGPSECIDPSTYHWRAGNWSRPGWRGQVVYELHLGTFTREGTCRAAIARLEAVRAVGVEAIELMPVAAFAGRRNWGYDGVALYAPAACYGRPDDLRALVDAAHGCGLAVILDVVYNHVGPAGCHLADFSPDYFHGTGTTPWGQPFNLDGRHSQSVRHFLLGNALAWLDEYRFDGLRLDATHAMVDQSAAPFLAELAAAVQARGAFVLAEDERNEPALLRARTAGGAGLDGLWADDFHHQVRVALTGTRASYFGAYCGTPAGLADTLAHGWTYRGQPYMPWHGRPRGAACDNFPPQAFVVCIENHDQIGNRAGGERLEHLVTPAHYRAAAMLLCLGPYAPLLFMGQEWAASTPFRYFTDHGGELGAAISAARLREFAGDPWFGSTAADPEAAATFAGSKLIWSERAEPAHQAVLSLYTSCLKVRHSALGAPRLRRGAWEVHLVGAFIALRYRPPGTDQLLLTTLTGERLPDGPLPPALAPAPGLSWRPVLHSEERRFGGGSEDGAPFEWQRPGPWSLWLEAAPAHQPDAAR